MRTKTIKIHLDGDMDGPETEITLHQARISDGIYRTELIGEALEGFKEGDKNTHDERRIGIVMRPSCLAALDKNDPLRHMGIYEFMKLSDQDANDWTFAAYELNPHWNPNRPKLEELNEEERKKKLTESGTLKTGSEPPTTTPTP